MSIQQSDVLYTAVATAENGRDGRVTTDDGKIDVVLNPPKEMGGSGAGTNPEQLFAVGFASCFESALSAVSRRQKVDADDAVIDSKVSLLPNESRGFDLAVELDVTLPSIDDADAAIEAVRAAHKVCPYSNATRGNIDVKLTANGQPV